MSDGMTDKRGGNDTAFVGVHKTGSDLFLSQADNGGWILASVPDHPGEMRKTLGAYSCAADMLEALTNSLCPELTS